MTIKLFGLLNRDPRKKINKGAFSGDLLCPYCSCTKQTFIERITPCMWKYRCNSCKCYYHYDVSPIYSGDLPSIAGDPYAGAPRLKEKLRERLQQSPTQVPRAVVMNGQKYDVGIHRYKK